MSRLWLAVPVLLFAALAGVFYLALHGEPPGEVPSPLIGKPVPTFSLPSPDGAGPGLSSTDFGQGRPVVLNVFASWCAPCRVEHPLLAVLAARPDVDVYGIAYKDAPEATAAFLDELGNPYARIGRDEHGRAAIEWGVYGVPETFLIGPDGRVLWKHAGALTPDILANELLPKLDSKRPD